MQFVLQTIHSVHTHTHARSVSLCSSTHSARALRFYASDICRYPDSPYQTIDGGSALSKTRGALLVTVISRCTARSEQNVEHMSGHNWSLRCELGILKESRRRLFSRLHTQRFVYANGGLLQEGKKYSLLDWQKHCYGKSWCLDVTCLSGTAEMKWREICFSEQVHFFIARLQS